MALVDCVASFWSPSANYELTRTTPTQPLGVTSLSQSHAIPTQALATAPFLQLQPLRMGLQVRAWEQTAIASSQHVLKFTF